MTWLAGPQRSMLLDLPAELRQRIFEFALVSDKPLVTFHIDEYQQEAYQEACQPALLMVNRQIRQEALPLFYGCNDFILFTEGKKADEAQHWLYRAQPYLNILGGIAFWLRHIKRVPTHNGSNGAISITMQYACRRERWEVCPDSKWISTIKEAQDAASDGKFLTEKLRSCISNEHRQLSAEFLFDLMSTLRKEYIEHKIH